MLHITDIRKFERCKRMFQLSHQTRKQTIAFINYNENMMDLVKRRLGIENAYEGIVNDEGARAMAALETHEVLINARFVYADMRVKIPVMIQRDGKRTVYFTYMTCFPKEGEAQTMADTLQVLELLHIHVDEINILHLNAQYVRHGALDVQNLFTITPYLYNGKNHALKKAEKLINMRSRDIRGLMEAMQDCLKEELYPAQQCSQCTRGLKCMYYDDCFHDKPHHTSILNLVTSQYKYDMNEEGLTRLAQADAGRIEGTRHQYAQIMADQNNGVYVDKGALRTWIQEHVHYPISYLDFEWETFAFPPYEGMKPYDVLAFQYSLHVEESQQPLQHKGFIGEGDCRIAFIEQLLHDIPKTGCIMVYNMEGAEKLRLKQLAKQYPQYESALSQIWERMVDLSLPFSTGNVYDTRMAGMYSLKTLVPLFSSCDYNDLDISFGMDAVDKHRLYSTAQGDEKQQLYDKLEAYCAMDTYGEYVVLHALMEMVDLS